MDPKIIGWSASIYGNKKIQRAVGRDKKQYYNAICKDIKAGKIRKVFQNFSKLRSRYQSHIALLKYANGQTATDSTKRKELKFYTIGMLTSKWA